MIGGGGREIYLCRASREACSEECADMLSIPPCCFRSQKRLASSQVCACL